MPLRLGKEYRVNVPWPRLSTATNRLALRRPGAESPQGLVGVGVAGLCRSSSRFPVQFRGTYICKYFTANFYTLEEPCEAGTVSFLFTEEETEAH